MTTVLKTLSEMWTGKETPIPAAWRLTTVVSEDCLSYVAWNEATREALLVDPKREELAHYRSIAATLPGYLWIGVFDTHTHADHVSGASEMAAALPAPLIVHHECLTTKAELRVCKRTRIPSHAGAIDLIPTPGHTPDGITMVWGPFVFTGDTVFYADVGRDDLPGGNPEAHYESLQTLKEILKPDSVVLPGHDHKGGRASTWATQLEVNSSLTQARESFVTEAREFQAPAPKDFKRALVENLK